MYSSLLYLGLQVFGTVFMLHTKLQEHVGVDTRLRFGPSSIQIPVEGKKFSLFQKRSY
jgi:hypothetical protein